MGNDIELASGAKFYATCAQSLRAAVLKQYGDNFTVADLRKNLEEQATAFGINWGAQNSEFLMVSQTADEMAAMIDTACEKYQAWLDAGKPDVA